MKSPCVNVTVLFLIVFEHGCNEEKVFVKIMHFRVCGVRSMFIVITGF